MCKVSFCLFSLSLCSGDMIDVSFIDRVEFFLFNS